MSCFWDGLLQALDESDFLPFGLEKKPSPANLLTLLQNNLVRTVCVLWQGQELTPFEWEENRQAVENLTLESIPQGYLCSVCDPVLLLVSEIFRVSIQHRYQKVLITYTNIHAPDRWIYVASNRGHFWAEKKPTTPPPTPSAPPDPPQESTPEEEDRLSESHTST